MNIKEYAKLKKGDTIYYITNNEDNKKVIGRGKVLKKYIERYFFNKNIFLKLINFSYDNEVENSTNIFLYHYDNMGCVTDAFNKVYLTKNEAQKELKKYENKVEYTGCLPWS